MQKSVLVSVATLTILAAACASPDSPSPTGLAAGTPSFTYELAVPGNAGDTPARVYLARDAGNAGRPGGGGVSPLVWHNGAVMNSAAVTAIYWGSSWGSYQGDKIAGLESFYKGLNNSAYMGTNTEYDGSGGTQVTRVVSFAASMIDATPGPTRAPKVADIEAEVCKVIKTNAVANGYYPVYTDLKRGHTGYCAWHSYGSCGGVPVQFGFFFDLDGDPGCDPGSPASYGHSQGLAALANVSGHEISEAVTDPRNGGWWDSSGAENSDKCAWTFSGSPVSLGGASWKIQGNFSNAALAAKSGYDRAGCIDGNK